MKSKEKWRGRWAWNTRNHVLGWTHLYIGCSTLLRDSKVYKKVAHGSGFDFGFSAQVAALWLLHFKRVDMRGTTRNTWNDRWGLQGNRSSFCRILLRAPPADDGRQHVHRGEFRWCTCPLYLAFSAHLIDSFVVYYEGDLMAKRVVVVMAIHQRTWSTECNLCGGQLSKKTSSFNTIQEQKCKGRWGYL